MQKYHSYKELKKNETLGKDYRIRKRYGKSGIVIMAPHGGGIEPGTTEIAEAVAGDVHTFYTFSGLKKQGNAKLHITSKQFDEPLGIEIVKDSRTILTIHGCGESDNLIYIGGKDNRLKEKVRKALQDANFSVWRTSRFPGENPLNICNRSRSCMGVQLEISAGLRRELFQGLSRRQRKNRTPHFEQFVMAIKEALSDHMGNSTM